MLASPVDFELADPVNLELADAAKFKSGFGRSEKEGAETFVVEINCGREEGKENSATDDAAYDEGGVVSRARRLCDFYRRCAGRIEERAKPRLGKAIARLLCCSIALRSEHTFFVSKLQVGKALIVSTEEREANLRAANIADNQLGDGVWTCACVVCTPPCDARHVENVDAFSLRIAWSFLKVK